MQISFIKNHNKIPYLLYWIIPIIISLITILVYYPSLNYPFQYDDLSNILKHFDIRNLTFKDYFFKDTRWLGSWLHTIGYKLGEFDPFYYRVINVVLHLITGILIFLLLLSLLSGLKNNFKNNFFKDKALAISTFTTTLFLLHPVATQTISYITQGQLEGLATLFVIAIVYFYVLWTKSKTFFAKVLTFIFLFILIIFSTGTKEIAIVSPFLIMITDWFFIAQGDWNSYKKRIFLHLIILLTVFGFFVYFHKKEFLFQILGLNYSVSNNIGNVLTKQAYDKITPWLYLISEFKVILHYIFIYIWPFNISVEYDWGLNNSFFDLTVLIPFLILLIFIGLIIYLLKKNRINPIVFGALWFFISILPRSSIVPSAELIVDYKTYLASIGLLFIIAWAIVKLIEKLSIIFKSKTLIYIISFIILSFSLGFITYQKNKVWRTSLEFWQNIITMAPQKARAYNNYGVELLNLKRFEESIPYFKKAIKMEENVYWDPYINLSAAYSLIGKLDLAISTIQTALKINPYKPEAYNNLGTLYLHKNDFYKAEECFDTAIKLLPHYGKPVYNKGRMYLYQGDIEKAWQQFKQACINSDCDHEAPPFELYATTSMHLSKFDDAIYACKKFIELEKTDKNAISQACLTLGAAYFHKKEYDSAAKTFEETIKIFPENMAAWANLIETYIIIKDYNKALETIEKAKKLQRCFMGVEIQEARALENLGKKKEAIKLLKEVIKMQNAPKEMKDMAKKYLRDFDHS